tara:strand:- start:997 stop:1296 length:300 start_codon:yes stop_codon:yes gene_type:complete
MFVCTLCEKETCYISKFCDKCRKIKHYLNLYDSRVYDVLDSILSRNIDKQENKIRVELGNEIKNKEQKIKEILNKEIESKLELKNDSCEPVKTRSQKKI